MKNWDDLRILLAVVKGGSITAGAELLGIDQSTVSRRLRTFESGLGRNLFHDTKKRNNLTPFGESCVESAQRLELEMHRLDQELRLNDLGFEGDVWIQTDNVLSDHLLLDVCPDFLKKYPKINLRISRDPETEKPLRADIAIFATNSPVEAHFGRKLATATFASYATHSYLKEFKDKPQNMTWVNWDDGSGSPTWPALSPKINDDMCRLRCSSIETLLEATRLGLGATILPCFIGETDPALSRITPGEIVTKSEVWVFVQADLRKIPKIRTFLDYLYAEILRRKDILECD